MNYRIAVYDGKNKIERYYEESFFEDNGLIGEAVSEMIETLKTPYPKEWDNPVGMSDEERKDMEKHNFYK